MSRLERKRWAISDELSVVVTDDGSFTLHDDVLGESFHSESGAAAESRVVFLENSGVAGRLKQNLPTAVLEIGFGTGLNFLLTAMAARRNGTELFYLGLDHRHLAESTLRALRFDDLIDDRDLLQWYLTSVASMTELNAENASLEFGCVRLDFWRGDALHANLMPLSSTDLQTSSDRPARTLWPSALDGAIFDAIFLDAFSPATCPQLWSIEFLTKLHSVLRTGGKLTTYCVKRHVRDAFRAAGFEIEKRAGPSGGKREVLVASK